MKYDYSKLRGKIKEVFGTQEKLATEIQISPAALSSRLNNATKFTQDEIVKCSVALNINDADVASYFFTKEVQKI